MTARLDDRLLTTREVARLFHVNERTVARWADAGRLTGLRTPGGQRRFSEAEVRALFAQASGDPL